MNKVRPGLLNIPQRTSRYSVEDLVDSRLISVFPQKATGDTDVASVARQLNKAIAPCCAPLS